MSDTFMIEFPKEVSDDELKKIQTELGQLEQVQGSGSMGARSIDAQSIMLWVSVATGILGVVKTGVPLVQSIIETLRGKGVKGAKITLANGTSFSADEMSSKDLESLLKASQGNS
jgi:hypothetical protein